MGEFVMLRYASLPEIRPLNESLEQVRFPISRDALLEDYGQVRIQMVHGQVLSLESALAGIVQPHFRSLSDLAVAVGENRRADEAMDW
jgi:hypothetical protein